MITEVTRLVDRWLKHGTYGVVMMLENQSRLTPEGDSDSKPPEPVILNDTEDESVTVEINPPTTPALVVFAQRGSDVDLSNRREAKRVQVAIAYIENSSVPALDAVRNGGYTLDAVLDSLTEYNSAINSKGYRTLNGVQIMAVESVTIERLAAAVGESRMWGFAIATLTVIVN